MAGEWAASKACSAGAQRCGEAGRAGSTSSGHPKCAAPLPCSCLCCSMQLQALSKCCQLLTWGCQNRGSKIELSMMNCQS